MGMLCVIMILVASASPETTKPHSLSATVIPIDPGLIYPDIGYEYFFTEHDAVGFSSGVGLINRFTYTRKFGSFCAIGSLGIITPDWDFHRIETFTALSLEYRYNLGETLYSRTVASAVFLEEMPYDIPLIPVFQIGFGWRF